MLSLSSSVQLRPSRLFSIVAIAGALSAGLFTPLGAQPYDIVQEYHIPISSANVREISESISTDVGTGGDFDTVHDVISLTALRANTVAVIDHWEDGFEADLSNPVQTSTEIFGNSDVSDGAPPGCAVNACDVINVETFIVLENDVDLVGGRDPSEIFYDGDDRIGVTEVIAMTRAGWRLEEDTLLAGAVEVFPTYLWSNEFEIPIGVDFNTGCDPNGNDNGLVAATASCMFEYTAASMTAGIAGADYELDYDGDGNAELLGSLASGESILLEDLTGGLRINTTNPVQVHLATGDVGSGFEGRWFNLVPSTQWADEYYSPVGSASYGQPTEVLLYNPSDAAFDVEADALNVLVASGATTGGSQGANISLGDGTCFGTLATRTITVPATTEVITDVDLRFQASGDYRGDIFVNLTSPDGTTVNVIGTNGGDSDNNYDVLLDDEAGLPLDDGGGDTIGGAVDRSATPTNALGGFDGENPDGTWTLSMCDNFAGGDPHTFEDAELFIETGTVSPTLTQTISVPAGGVSFFRMPVDSGARFSTPGGEPFFAIATVDYNNTSSDWGFTLLPAPQLTTSVVAGWAPGRNQQNTTNQAENGSPIWVTAVADTTIRIDYEGDGIFDLTGVPLAELQSLTIFDPDENPTADNNPLIDGTSTSNPDQNGMVIESETGVLITAAWGQDARVASAANPAIDVGTTVVPVPVLDLTKDVVLYEDINGDGDPDSGDTLEYTITVRNVGTTSATDVELLDPVIDASTVYVADSTELDGSPVADDTVGSTTFPLDEGGISLGTIAVSSERLITFRVVINDPLPGTVLEILNTAIVTSPNGGGTSSTVVPVPDPEISLAKTSQICDEAGGGGSPDWNTCGSSTFAEAGDYIRYELTLTNTGITPQVGIDISDALPDGTSYVSQSTVVQGFELDLFQALDLFEVISYANQNGPSNWSSNWIEQNDAGGAGPGSGDVRIEEGELRLDSSAGGTNEAAYRSVDLSALVGSNRAAALNFIWRTGPGTDPTDEAIVEVFNGAGAPGGSSCASFTVTGFTAANSDYESLDLGACTLTGPLTVRVRIVANFGGADEFFAIDNVVVRATASTAANITNDGGGGTQLDAGIPPNLVVSGDEFGLQPGESMTVTFEVQVHDPLDPFRPSIVNTATATTLDNPFPIFASVVDPVEEGGAIGDRVWIDVDGDGIDDVGEPGIPNVTLTLFDDGGDGIGGGNDTVVGTTTTDSNGNYLFDNLPPGSYFVDVTDSDIPTGLSISPGSTDPSSVRSITGNEEFFDADFGYRNAATDTAIIGDLVWSDGNADGVRQPNEPGIGGVTIDLIDLGPDGIAGTPDDSVDQTVTTNADGTYYFVAAAPGSYVVQVTDTGNVLDGQTLTIGPQSQGNPTVPITVIADDVYLEADFGYSGDTNDIFDSVWIDTNNDTFFNPAETGIEGVTVSLVDLGDDGVPGGAGPNADSVVATAATDAMGDFSFIGVPDGNYRILITDTNNATQSLGPTTSGAADGFLDVTMAGADIVNETFGYNAPGVIGDTVWNDANNNQVRDPGESGFGGVEVNLYRDIDTDGEFEPGGDDGSPVATTLTDAFGNYQFVGLEPGDYFVGICTVDATEADCSNDGTNELPTGYTLTTPDDDTTGADGAQLLSSLGIGESDLTNDFGYRNTALFDISGTVFDDEDRDGFREPPADTGIADVKVVLLDDSGDMIAMTRTDSSGFYEFPDLPNGDYTVEVVPDDSPVLVDYQLTSGVDSLPVTISGADQTDNDFGYAKDTPTGSIGDTVFNDANRDGVLNGDEGGIPGVNVALFDAGPDGIANTADDTQLATDLTDANGQYLFDDLPAGNYFVRVLDSDDGNGSGNGDAYGNPNTALAGFQRTDTDGIGGDSSVISLSEGQNFDEADFGFAVDAGPPDVRGSIGDEVYLDADGNGSRDAGEPGIAGVRVDLFNAGPNNVIGGGDDVYVGSTVTDQNGLYLFDDLAPDEYFVRVRDAANVTGDPANNGDNVGNVNTPLEGLERTNDAGPEGTGANSALITLGDNQSVTTADFGYEPSGGLAVLGDTVFFDDNANGTQDAGELGIPGILVTVVPNGGGTPVTTLTNASGNYLFTLPSGVAYDVSVCESGDAAPCNAANSLPAGLTQTTLGGNNPFTTPVLPASGNLDVDFGFDGAAYATIGDSVYRDNGSGGGIANNGTQDGSEPGIPGVTVNLVNADTGVQVATTTTDGSGNYSFTGLDPDTNYRVEIDASTLPAALYPTQQDGAVPASVLTAGGPPYNDADFGFNGSGTGETGTIGDRVFLDVDGDGVQDAGEPGIGGVTVQLWTPGPNGIIEDGGGDDTVPLAPGLTTTLDTAPDGYYLFENVPAGDYYVLMDDTTAGVGNGGTPLAGLSRTDGNGPGGATNTDTSALISLADGQEFTDADFGYDSSGGGNGLLGDTVYYDADGDSTQDPGELGLPGIGYIITPVGPLPDCTASSGPTSTCGVTNGAGNYLETLPAADYTIVVCVESAPGVYAPTVPADPGPLTFFCNATNSVPLALSSTEAPSNPVTVPAGGAFLDADFGFDEPGDSFVSIGDTVYRDDNGNGVQDGVEPGLGGVTLDLVDDTGTVIGQTTTDGSGNYTFTGVPVSTGTPGTTAYTVVVTDQNDVIGGLSQTESGGTVLVDDVDTAGDTYLDADFGYTTQQELGDTVFVDVIDGSGVPTPDGFQQPNELGIPDVFVIVVPQSENANPIDCSNTTTQCVTTDQQGRWSVLVPSGSYTVFVCSDMPDYGSTVPSDCSVSNSVPAGYNQLTTSFAQSGTRNPQTFNVATGSSILYADFGFQEASPITATIGDTVYFDSDGNGSQGGTEPGIENVTIELFDLGDDGAIGDTGANADVSVATTVTDQNGNYRFYGVDPTRSYQVVVTDVADLLGTLNPTEAGPDGTETVLSSSLAAGADFNDADFGYEASGGVGAIGNKIWRDLTDPDGNAGNGDGGITGLFQDGEPGIESVEVQLWRDRGRYNTPGDPASGCNFSLGGNGEIEEGCDDLERTTFTDELGNYFFLGLPVDIQYIVDVTDVLGVTNGMSLATCDIGDCPDQTADNVSKSDPYVVNLTSGAPNNFAADFGYIPDVPPRSVSGLVYFDANNDGNYQSATDRGEPEVLVTLFREIPASGGGAPTYVRFGQQRTTLTDTSGAADLNYRFTDLPAGEWRVVIDNVGTFLDGANQTEPATSPSVPSATRDADTTAGDASEVDFGFYRAPTLVIITDVRSVLIGGQTALRFETGSEIGSVGFYAWRLDPETGDYVQVNEEMVVAANAPQGAVYTIPDPGAEAGKLTYVIYEVEMRGGEQVYGPITVETEETDGLVGVIERLEAGPVVEAKQPSERDRERFRRAQAEEYLMAVDPASVVGTTSRMRRNRSDTAQVRVTDGGLQRLDSATIAAATGAHIQMVEAWIQAGNWQLRRDQRQVAWYPSADGTAIMFYAPEPTSLFTPWTPYHLSRGRGLAMPSKAAGAAPGPVSIVDDVTVAEEDSFFALSGVVDEERDIWFWTGLGGSTRKTLDFDVVGATGAGGLLEVQMYGASDYAGAIDHRIEIWLNPADPANPQPGESLGVFEFGGFGDHRLQVDLPSSLVQSGSNSLVFESLDTGFGRGSSFIDWIRVHTQRSVLASGGSAAFTANAGTSTVAGLPLGEAVEVFEIGGTVRRLSGVSVNGDAVSFATDVGRRYFVTATGSEQTPTATPWAELTGDTAGAEYVVIVPAQLRAAADRLAEYRSGLYSTSVFEVEAIFNDYAAGDRNPAAIREFLANAWANWSTKPRFVTLLGRGNFDYRDLLGYGGNLLPPLMRGTPAGTYSADALLADVEGDERPEFAIGRIPSLTNAEANAYIDKLIAYEETPAVPSSANRDVLFLNDDEDYGGRFAMHSQRYGVWVTQQPETHYTIDTAPFTDLNALRSELFDRLNDGAYWLNLTGHGGLSFFAQEQAFTADDVANNLVEADRLPIVTTFSCTLGRYELPMFSALGETLTLAENKGAIAVFAPSGVTYDPAARIFGDRLFEEAFGTYAQDTLGEAILEASSRFRAEGGADYMLDVYNLLGDPALQLQRP